jgi:hypothetical protein
MNVSGLDDVEEILTRNDLWKFESGTGLFANLKHNGGR